MEAYAELLATERYGSGEPWQYVAKDGSMERRRDSREAESRGNTFITVFKSVFLPQGYPDSVSGDYLQYQFWDTLQAFSSSLSGTLATQASLKGVGVGNQEATVAAATVTWLLRDGTSMLGRIVFAWLKGNKLDSEAKKWRLFADILNDIAMFMEILAPFYPACFTLIVCTSGIFKSVVGVAGGATRAALTVHQARRDNMADISAKDGSQETLVNLAGLLVSLILIPLVTDNPALTLTLFFLFTALHLFANFKAVRSVVMETLNEARLAILLRHFLRDGHVLTPLEANREEPVFLEFRKTLPIKLGVRLQEVVQRPEELRLAMRKDAPFLLGVTNGCVRVCLASHAHTRDEIKAMCQAIWLSDMLNPSRQHHGLKEMLQKSYKLMDVEFDRFLKGVEAAGWDATRTLLDWDEWRLEWNPKIR
ncbi:RUS1 family protein C16orf58 homolog [Corythoichthys intestinalis]|uniref:RUS1 family protein C16orf58 homolog n=1 Tax=Corythoichthys intestinalis TaxID=161448 RepID=UPI0025A650CF|nr:RUS1 family protein C16orf58 homolog [Corythoichthys intestinalis]XP_057673053.1 RUS1 family protein C16orf58 homolog [Corythoichthys intestinalis]XP_057673054.1 RUS1 family protein C16orf58 homolog [Corythoichthys intestinalis]XP_061805078.1 RUS family member 1-like [Nerophis lumbriciformis]